MNKKDLYQPYIKIIDDRWDKHLRRNLRRPKTWGSVDYPSTRRIQVDIGLPDVTSENRAESPLYGELSTQLKYLHETCPKQSNIFNISNISNHMSNTATWAHNDTHNTY